MHTATKLFSAALLFAALLVVGCDSGTLEPTDDTTTVQFARSGASVTQADGTVSIDVQISNPPSAAVSVEVLFADSASTADGDDIGGFATQRVTFPASAEGGAVQSVSFDVADDGDSAEEAIFALQQVSGPAQIGDQRTFALRIGQNVITLGALRAEAQADGDSEATGTVQGLVTDAEGTNAVIQDDTGGLVIRQTSGAFFEAIGSGDLAPGDSVLVTGTTSAFNGLLQINEGGLESYEVVNRGNDLPEPQVVTLGELSSNGDRYESTLIRVEDFVIADNRTTFEAGGAQGNYALEGVDNVELRIPSGSVYTGDSVPRDPVTFVGLLGQFNNFQLLADDEGTLLLDGDDGGDDGDGDVSTLAEARMMDDGTAVTVEGVFTRIESINARIQDTSGDDGATGLTVRDGALADAIEAGDVELGDRLRITGGLGSFNGLKQIDSDVRFEVVEEGAGLPEPAEVSLDELSSNGESYESELVRVESLSFSSDDAGGTFEDGTNYTVTDEDGDELALRVTGGSFYTDTEIPSTATFTGVLGQFDNSETEPLDAGYQLLAIAEGDLADGEGDSDSDSFPGPPARP